MMTDTTNILVAEGLHKSYGRGAAAVHALRGVDLRVGRGQFVAVMGPSGCGKSTLLHVVGLMTPPDAGRIVLDGRQVGCAAGERNALRRTHVGLIFQRFNLLGELSAADNVAVSLRVRGRAMDGQAERLFEALGVAHVMRRKPSQMSIGEQQRVAVVRALAHRPALLLADEPTGNLDSANSEALLELLRRVNHQDGQTIVMITHSAAAAAAADRIVHMKDGRIVDAPR